MSTQTTPAPTKVITGKVRFSYLHVFEPKAIDGSSDAKYSVSLIIPKSDTETIEKVKAAIKSATEAGKATFGNKIPANLKTPLRDGDEERPDDPAYKDAYFINANSKNKPGLVDKDRQPIIDKDEMYSGCYGRASVNFYAYNTNGNKGIAAGLNHLQKLADGEPLGNITRAEDDFADDFQDDDLLG
ncbi:DUF2815 family protein [Candidatus Dependentiae bacterium]|nr:DUF2815 family protein [Candidatus Dependentiae bacterium]